MTGDVRIEDPANWVTEVIQNFINESSENTLKNAQNDKAWADPLVGFCRGDDPLYQRYKEVVGPFHWSPEEIFRLTYPASKLRGDRLTVISWVLPQTEDSKSDNRRETLYPSERWARARIFGEEVNVKLRKHVVTVLKKSGFEAVAPMLSPIWERKMSERYVYSSTWSERHAAYAAGLGTFGLCDGLITPKGKAMRCGSVVAHIQIPPTTRPYEGHHAYCLFYVQGTCKKCAERCPAGAITESGHDKRKCHDYIHPAIDAYVESRFGFKGYGCGLCQTGVPCESENPVKGDGKKGD
jgi:epoxyqueuosine reductase QueG